MILFYPRLNQCNQSLLPEDYNEGQHYAGVPISPNQSDLGEIFISTDVHYHWTGSETFNLNPVRYRTVLIKKH